MDGISILLDGVCSKVEPYEVTPKAILDALTNNYPDAVGFTHQHPDHFHSGYLDFCTQTGTVILMPGAQEGRVGDVNIYPIKTRHLGKVEPDLIHNSFLICGRQTILFAGDAAPSELQAVKNVDVLIAPYAYVTTSAGIKAVISTGAKQLILVHMPGIDPDPYGIWESVRTGLSKCDAFEIVLPQMGQEIEIV